MGIQERKAREKDMRRKAIQDAAKELFLLKSFNSTTMEEIAKKAELSPGAIYIYFKNKEELYFSLNLVSLQYLFKEIKKVFDNKKISVEEKIYKFKEGMYKTYRYDPLLFRNILHVQLENTLSAISKDIVDNLNNLSKKMMSMIANVYEEGVRQGKFTEGHGMAHADIMWGLFSGLVTWEESKKRLNPEKDFLKSTLDRAFDIVCCGIKNQRGTNELGER